MNIRTATQADLPSIDTIYNQAIEEKLTADTTPLTPSERSTWFKDHDINKYPIFVYEIDNEIIGWLSFSKYRNGRAAVNKTVEISYYIDKKHRNKGIGAQLILYAKTIAKQYGFQNLIAIILERNNSSIKLIEKYGFKNWGYLPKVADFDGEVCGHFYYGINL